jgi:hypothetical protein
VRAAATARTHTTTSAVSGYGKDLSTYALDKHAMVRFG